jgi:hypothetical protein
MAKREIRAKDGYVWVDPKTMRAMPEVTEMDDSHPDFAGQAHKFYPAGVSAPKALKEEAAASDDAAPRKRPVRKEQLETR